MLVIYLVTDRSGVGMVTGALLIGADGLSNVILGLPSEAWARHADDLPNIETEFRLVPPPIA